MYKYTLTIQVDGKGKEISLGLPVYIPSQYVILSGDDVIKGYQVEDEDGKVMDFLDFRVGVGTTIDAKLKEL